MAPRVWQKKALTIVDSEGEGGTERGSEIKAFHLAACSESAPVALVNARQLGSRANPPSLAR